MHEEKQTWEYLRINHAEANLDTLGTDGWELVAMGDELIFKRPPPGFRERVTVNQKRAVYERFDLPWPPPSQRGKGA